MTHALDSRLHIKSLSKYIFCLSTMLLNFAVHPINSNKMPAIKGNAGSLPVKRKRASSDKRPIKRARSESDSEMEDSDDDGQSEILLLEAKIFESKKNYNNIPKLIQILRREIGNQGDEVVAAIALCRVFTRFMAARDMTEKKDAPENEVVVVRWLRKQYENYRQELVGLLSEEELAPTAFAICMRLLKSEGQYLRSSTEYNFPTAFLREIVYSLVKAGGTSSSIRSEFSEKFVEEYDDIRFYTLHALELVIWHTVYIFSSVNDLQANSEGILLTKRSKCCSRQCSGNSQGN